VSWPVTEAWSVPKVPRVGSDCLLRLALPCSVIVGSRLLSATRIEVEATSTSKLGRHHRGMLPEGKAGGVIAAARQHAVHGFGGAQRAGPLPITWV
jgi:hypothetical protein